MRLITQLGLLTLLLVVSGCHWFKPAKPVAAPGAMSNGQPVVKASDELAGKVVSFNTVGRFVVLNFPVTHMPAIDQKLFLYRDGLRVGEIKITGPQKDDNIVGDLTFGEAKPGDEVRDR